MKNDLVEHHIKYKEIHGVDKTIWITRSEHILLHKRLRREKKCNISVEELKMISIRASSRTNKAKKQLKEYKQTEQHKNYQKQYKKDIIERFIIRNTIAPNILLREEIIHNKNTRTIFVSSSFIGNHGTKLIIKEI